LSAETEQQRRAAVRGNSGKLGRIYEGWRQQLLYARGELEALIDFSEDQHFDESPAELLSNVTSQVKVMLQSIEMHESASHRGELLKRGIRISLLGPPNAGKSSLLNQIVGREASIVSGEAGTTRDIVEVSLDIRGYLCTFADTAGLRTKSEQSLGSDPVIGDIEQEGIRRAKAKAGESDVIIALASIEPSGDGTSVIRYDTETLAIAGKARQSLVVLNKSDSIPKAHLEKLLIAFSNSSGVEASVVSISCKEAKDGHHSGNIPLFIDQLVKVFENLTDLPPDLADLIGVTERQRQLLYSCSEYLRAFIDEARPSDEGAETDIVLAAEHLRSAATCLSRITGRGEAGDVEEVLGVVFEK
jgi:tRNA modification GTPase